MPINVRRVWFAGNNKLSMERVRAIKINITNKNAGKNINERKKKKKQSTPGHSSFGRPSHSRLVDGRGSR